MAAAAVAAGLAAGCAPAHGQTLPATPATSLPVTAPLTATPAQPDAATRAHHADVRYEAGLLSINASNSSLNQILRDISRATGMKITGGVREERVFGHYGPASPSNILATLIDGTGTNMLLRQGEDASPQELVLTPRNGGPTPPNPSAANLDNGDDDAFGRDQQPPPPISIRPGAPDPSLGTPGGFGPRSIPQPANDVNGSSQNVTPTASQIPTVNSVPLDSLATPSTTPPSTGIVDTPNPPDPGTVSPTANTTTDTSPSGVKTPEQIYQQLQQMRQQQQKQPQ